MVGELEEQSRWGETWDAEELKSFSIFGKGSPGVLPNMSTKPLRPALCGHGLRHPVDPAALLGLQEDGGSELPLHLAASNPADP